MELWWKYAGFRTHKKVYMTDKGILQELSPGEDLHKEKV